MPHIIFSFLLLLVFSGCRSHPPQPGYREVEIEGRLQNAPLYRAKMPLGWELKPKNSNSRIDTTQALAEFILHQREESIRLTFHNFPVGRRDQEIPPSAQIARWKGQFSYLDLNRSHISFESFAGFVGYLFEGSGVLTETLDDKGESVLGWAMELAQEHKQHIQEAPFQEMRASFTIKAVGPTHLMDKERASVMKFARSFELIEALPSEL